MLIYTPALVRALYNYIITDKPGSFDNLWRGHDVSWWTKNAIVRHPYMLISYFYEGEKDNWRESARVCENTEIFGDCGAYSATSRGVALDPEEVCKWQSLNCEVGFTLDSIPANLEVASQVGATRHTSLRLEDFKKHAHRSRDNYLKAIQTRDKNSLDLSLYLIMHGDTNEKWNYWWNTLQDLPINKEIDGFGTGLKPTINSVLQLSCLARLHSYGTTKNIHLLGVSGTNVIPALAFAAKHIHKVTFDSMSYAQGSMSRGFFLFNNFIRQIIGFGTAYDIHPKGKPIPCSCPICSLVEDADTYRGPGTLPGLLIALHNLHAYNEYTKKCYDLAKSCTAEEMIRELKGTRSEDAIAGINFFNDYLNDGIEKTMDRWKEQLRPKLEAPENEQLSLF